MVVVERGGMSYTIQKERGNCPEAVPGNMTGGIMTRGCSDPDDTGNIIKGYRY